MDFLAIVVLVVAVALVYWFWIRKPNVVEPVKAEEPAAPYKVETPVEVASTTWPAATESVEIKVVEPTVTTAVPELKVVSNQPKKARAPRPRARKPAAKPSTTAATQKKPRQPKQ